MTLSPESRLAVLRTRGYRLVWTPLEWTLRRLTWVPVVSRCRVTLAPDTLSEKSVMDVLVKVVPAVRPSVKDAPFMFGWVLTIITRLGSRLSR